MRLLSHCYGERLRSSDNNNASLCLDHSNPSHLELLLALESVVQSSNSKRKWEKYYLVKLKNLEVNKSLKYELEYSLTSLNELEIKNFLKYFFIDIC